MHRNLHTETFGQPFFHVAHGVLRLIKIMRIAARIQHLPANGAYASFLHILI